MATDPAKISLALCALHVITSFILFDSCIAFWALFRKSLVQVLLEGLELKDLLTPTADWQDFFGCQVSWQFPQKSWPFEHVSWVFFLMMNST